MLNSVELTLLSPHQLCTCLHSCQWYDWRSCGREVVLCSRHSSWSDLVLFHKKWWSQFIVSTATETWSKQNWTNIVEMYQSVPGSEGLSKSNQFSFLVKHCDSFEIKSCWFLFLVVARGYLIKEDQMEMVCSSMELEQSTPAVRTEPRTPTSWSTTECPSAPQPPWNISSSSWPELTNLLWNKKSRSFGGRRLNSFSFI